MKHWGLFLKSIQQQSFAWGLPWWFSGPLVKNSPANVGDMGSIPGVGMKNPQAAGQLSTCAVTADACAPRARSMRGQHSKRPVRCTWGAAPARQDQRRPACTVRTQGSQKQTSAKQTKTK